MKIRDRTAEEEIKRAKLLLQRNNPMFAHLVMRLKAQERDDLPVPTMGVNNKFDLVYDAEFVKSLSDLQLMTVLCHEVLHCALGHCTTEMTYEYPMIANVAMDLVVNDLIIEAGISDVGMSSMGRVAYEFPKSCGLLPDTKHNFVFKDEGLVIENINKKNHRSIYYEILEHMKKNSKEQLQNCKKNREDNSSGSGGAEEKGKADEDGGGSGGAGKSGFDTGFDMHEISRVGGDEKRRKDQEVATIINEAIEYAKQKGCGTGGMDRFVSELQDSKVGWRELLYRYITRGIVTNYTYARPSRRSEIVGVYLPSVVREGMEIVVSIDTSGSISTKELKEFVSELYGIVKGIRHCNCLIIVHDDEVTEVLTLENGNVQKIKDLKLTGGGGTSHIPVFDYIEKNNIQPNVYIGLTDGYTVIPNKEPGFPVIWCLSGKNANKQEYGVNVEMEDYNNGF